MDIRLSLAFAALHSLLWAQQPPTLSLTEAVAESIARNPLLAAADERVASAEGFKLQARLKPNPRVVIQNENSRLWDFKPHQVYFRDTDITAYGALVVERGAKRERRIDYAAAGVGRASTERRLLETQIRNRVATAYWSAVAGMRILNLYREDVRNFGQIVEYNRQRVKEGAAAGVDLIRVEIERDRLTASARMAEGDADQALMALFREMGRIDFARVTLTTPMDKFEQVTPVPIAEAFGARPEVRVAESLIAQTGQNILLQRADGHADPEVQLGYKRTNGFDTIYAGVSIPLAIRNRNQGNISAAAAELRYARSTLEGLRNQVRNEVEAASRDYFTRKATLTETVEPLRTRTREAADLALAAYREGGVDLLRFLDAERVRIEAEVLYYRSLAELQQSVVALKRAEGQDQ